MKVMTHSVVHSKSTVNRLKTMIRLSTRTNEELISCSSQVETSVGKNLDTLLKHMPPVYLGFAINVEKAILRCCGGDVSEQIPFIAKLKRNWERESENVKKMEARREDGALCMLSIPILKLEMYSQYTPSAGSADQCLPEVVQYEIGRV